jgi:hypothetical protein
MVPNVSTLDAHGCGWICLDPDCPELAATELDAECLVEARVPADLARRLTKLILRRADEAEAPARARERAQADLARLRQDLLEAQQLASEAAALADRLAASLHVSIASDDFDVGQRAVADLAVVSALSRLATHTTSEACASVARIDPDLPGPLATRDS